MNWKIGFYPFLSIFLKNKHMSNIYNYDYNLLRLHKTNSK